MKTLSRCALAVVLLTAGCSDTRETTTITRPDVPPARLLTFTGTLQPKGINSHLFGVTRAGEVEVTLLGVSLVGGVQSQLVTVGLGIGVASAGGACLLTHSVNTQGGTSAQLNGTGQEGTLCISIFDVGNLTAPSVYTVTVATP